MELSMSLIPCAKDCGYQKDGYCSLESCAPVTNSAGGCPYYIRPGGAAPVQETPAAGTADLPVQGNP